MEKDLFNDNITRDLLKKNLIEEPSVDFTEQLMKKITAQEKQKAIIYKPIISKKAFGIIILSAIILIIVLISLPSSYFNSPYNSVFINIYSNLFSNINLSFLNKIPVIIPITIIAAWILIFSDLLINRIINKKITTD